MKAYELLARPENWTQGTAAKDVHGNTTNSTSEDAVCWCVLGAMSKLGLLDRREELMRHLNVEGISAWNDAPERKHEEVYGALKELDL